MSGKEREEQVLAVKVSVKVEERAEHYYAAVTDPFAITAYGDTPEEAEHQALQALLMLLNRHSSNADEARAYLSRKKVKTFHMRKVSDKARPVVECSRELSLAGAAHGWLY